MQTAELIALPLADRLQAIETLWDSLCRDANALQVVPAWHEQVLRERVAAIESGDDAVTHWEDAKQRIRQKAEQFVAKRQ